MRVLLLGGSGLLGTALQRTRPAEVTLDAPPRAALDVTDVDALERRLRETDAQWVINAAAYTAVDRAESEEREARRLNAELPAALGRELAARGIPLLHYSTDYVFSGQSPRPWREDDACSPASAYGRTKREGETRLLESGVSSLILRTAWLYGHAGKSFARTMWERARRGESSRVVDDQRGAPTNAADLATWSWTLIRGDHRGIMHAANAGETTWADVAERIYLRLRSSGTVTRVPSSAYAAPAPRPRYSVLDGRRLDAALAAAGAPPRRHWDAALDAFIDELEETAGT